MSFQLVRVISYVKHPVQWDRSESRDMFTVSGVTRLRRVLQGTGLLYFWVSRLGINSNWDNQFALLHGAPSEFTKTGTDRVTVSADTQCKFSCSGVITRTQEGYIFAPAFQLDMEGRDIVLMLLSATAAPHYVSAEKPMLALPYEEATIALSTENGELRCTGTVSGRFKVARLVLNRNPGLPVYKDGFNETLCEVTRPGSVSAVWKPTGRTFEESLMVFHPTILNTYGTNSKFYPRELADRFGASEDDIENLGDYRDFVLGDGAGANYAIRLVLDRGMGRHASDEARLTIT